MGTENKDKKKIAELILTAEDGFTGELKFSDAKELYDLIADKIGHTKWTLEYIDAETSGTIISDKTNKVVGMIRLLDGLRFKVTMDFEDSVSKENF